MQSIRKKSFAAEQLALRQKKTSPVVWVLVGVVVVALVVGGYVMYQRSVQEQVETETPKIKSIAVLPFRNMNADEAQDFFCEGIAETIINTLTQIQGLDVTARTSAFSFKGKEVTIEEIGEKLNVQTILEGSVQKEGDNIRISAQLIKVDDGFHLWSKQYNKKIDSIFAIQDEISQAIVRELKGALLPGEKAAIEKQYTDNTEAYNLYLMGRYHLNKFTRDGTNKALDYFQQAIDKDTNFVLAHAFIANAYVYGGIFGFLPRTEAYSKAKQAIDKAIQIDDTISETYLSMAYMRIFNDWDWPAAERAIKRAIELNPGSVDVHNAYAFYLWVMGRCDEALDEVKRAMELDPVYIETYNTAMALNIRLDRYDEAMVNFQKGIEIDPNGLFLQNHLGRLYRKQGNYTKAIEVFKERNNKFALGYTFAVSGDRDKAVEILHEYLERSKKENGLSDSIAMLYGVLGENDRAFEWLDQAYEAHQNFPLLWIKTDYEWDPIRPDPRFKALLKKMGLPED